jgi:hypothetical protein
MKYVRAASAPIKFGAAIVALAVAAAGCGSSAKSPAVSAGSGSPASTSPSASVSATAPPASTKTIALPAPCTLLTIADVEPLFGTTALQMTPTTGPVQGVAECSFNLSVGVQAKTVSVVTHTDFPHDLSYVFPSQGTTPVSGLGDPAVLQTNQGSNGASDSTLTVKLGTNALAIHVEWYTDPVNNAFVTQLTKTALARAHP